MSEHAAYRKWVADNRVELRDDLDELMAEEEAGSWGFGRKCEDRFRESTLSWADCGVARIGSLVLLSDVIVAGADILTRTRQQAEKSKLWGVQDWWRPIMAD
jgi:hypothetical protein